MSEVSDKQILDLCMRLANLLRDPEPGLREWRLARFRAATELRDALNAKLPHSMRLDALMMELNTMSAVEGRD